MFSVYFFLSNSFIDPVIKSDIRFRIDTSFREHKVTIPFPQRDVHIYPTNLGEEKPGAKQEGA